MLHIGAAANRNLPIAVRFGTGLGQGLGLLCHANVGEPPPLQWQESYLLLKQGIGAFLGRLPRQGAARLAHAAAQLDLGWYTQLLARVHINSFK